MNAPPVPSRIVDPADPRLDPFRSLRATPTRPRRPENSLDHVVVEGHLALRNVLRGPLTPNCVLVSENRLTALSELTAGVPASAELLTASRQLIEDVTGFDVHRGVLAAADRPPPLDPGVLLQRSRRVAVLIGLGDLENTGAVFRVAAALGLDAIALDHRCADPLYRRCVRVSLGWSGVIPHARIPPTSDPVEFVRGLGLTTVALTPRPDAVAVDAAAGDAVFSDPVALLVGSEGQGLDEATMDAADVRVRIPMANGVDSLNAATSLAVVASFAASTRDWR